MEQRHEKEPGFRRAIYLLMGLLLLGYMVVKFQHIRVAIEAFQGQELNVSTKGAAK